ncbi:hypothetical protein, partial [Ferroplasma sp. Type II]|uniref:hypothetical protein n=1 Tax=Ferroplasma sp. Type II TaxID=261388 RepID=UPI0025C3BACC
MNSDELSGGTYIVSATYNGKTISRTINIPDIVSVSVTVNSSPSYYSPHYNLLLDHYFHYTSSSGTRTVYELSNNNNASISSSGYYMAYASAKSITSMSLVPEKVMVDVFVSNGNATVKMNGTEAQNDGGYHYLS